MSKLDVTFMLCAALVGGALGCGDDPPPPAAAAAKAKDGEAKKSRKVKPEEAPKAELPPLVSAPIDFIEASRWRDPFVSYASEFAREAKKRVKSQREVVLDQYALDELKLA